MILVVDDNEISRDAVITDLTIPEKIDFEGISLEIIEASSAATAKRLLERYPETAVVILDIVMEDSGFEVIKYLRDELKNFTTQIIVRSGQTNKTVEKTEGKIKIPSWEDIIKQYSINGIIEKFGNNGMSGRLSVISLTLAGLRAFHQLNRLSQKNEELRFILSEIEGLYKKGYKNNYENNKWLLTLIENMVSYKSLPDDKNYLLEPEAIDKLIEVYKKMDIVSVSRLLFNTIERAGKGTITVRMLEDQINSERQTSLRWADGKQHLIIHLWELLLSKTKLELDVNEIQLPLIGEIDFNIFEKHHIENYLPNKINWLGTRYELMFLYYNLNIHGFLGEGFWPGIHRFLEDHYLYDNKPISSNTIKNYKSRITNDKGEYDWPELKNYGLICEITQSMRKNLKQN